MPVAMSPAAPALQEALENAGRIIDRQIQDDRCYPDLSELLVVPAPGSPTVSGMSDMDYPLQGPGLLSIPNLPEISSIRRVPLPPELVEQFGHMQCNCMMGVFPDISRAWLTIDSDIFMWNYEDGGDLAYFDGLSETILAVGLVKPKAGIFQPHVRYLLVLATPVDIVILGLSYANLQADPIVQIAIDNSRNILYTRSEKGVIQVYDLGQDGQGMTRVASVSQNAVVSAAGNIARTIDRSVFKPIVQIAVIENSESIDCQLLAVTHAGVRMYFSTSPFKHPMARPSMLTLVHIRLPPGFSAASNVEKPSKVHRALYSKGVLLMAASENEDNDILWCINHDSFPFQKPMMETQMTTHVDGHSWALSAIDELKVPKIITPLNKDLIPITDSPVVVQQHMLPPKKFVLLSAQGSLMFHKLRPVDQLRHLLVCNVGGDGEEIERFFKLHQEDQACATCLILACSAAACDREVSAWATRAFFRYGGEAQMRFPSALPPPSNVGPILGSPVPASSPMPIGSPYPNPSFLTTPAQGLQPLSMSTPMFAAASSMSQAGASMSGMMGPEIVFSGKHNGICIYFSRIIGNIWDGSIVVEKVFKSGNREVVAIESSVPSHMLESVLQELKGLQEFLDRNSQFATVGALGNPSFSTPANLQQRLLGFMRPDGGSSQQVQQELQRKFHAEAQLTEKTSLQGIQQLVHKTCQALALWKLLCEHQFNVVVGELQKEFQEHLKITTFKDLVIRDKELTGALIASLINCYIRDNAAVDGISSHLQDICPLLYSTDDAVCSKANELLQRSRQVQSKLEKEKMLRESLKEYQKISNQVDLSNVCAQYRQVRFYEGVVELSLTAAEKKDPQGLGLHFYKNGEPDEDIVGLQAFQERQVFRIYGQFYSRHFTHKNFSADLGGMIDKPSRIKSRENSMLAVTTEVGDLHNKVFVRKIIPEGRDWLNSYKCITDTLQELVNQSKAAPQSPSVPKKPGPPVLSSDPNMLSNEEAGQHFEQMLKLAQRSTDELFSIALYNWLIQADLADKLLQITSPFLEPYLVRMAKIDQNKVRYMDLLWRYFEKNRNFSNAARVLAKLADMHSTEIPLQQRLEYIARAILSAKSSTAISSIAADGEFLHELEEKMEVARIQLQIEETLQRQYFHHSSVQDAISQLDSELMDITKLYGEFADPFKLSECQWGLREAARAQERRTAATGSCDRPNLRTQQDPYWNRMKKPLHLLECIHVLLSGYVQDPNKVLNFERSYKCGNTSQTHKYVGLLSELGKYRKKIHQPNNGTVSFKANLSSSLQKRQKC
ncbi:hypothetical protein UY3_12603 [Chelonia mydas]|uniref:Nuclear pore complex protein Nup155 n=1 Tax=Chelonia mydas TaxID=8469 RepID=M7BDQ9_CHEMY|nr:hypothetical protein UY3_12603 [Chelonia mydas]